MTMSIIPGSSTESRNHLDPSTTSNDISHVDHNIPTISEPTTATQPTTSASHTVAPPGDHTIASSTSPTTGLENMSNTTKQPTQHGTLGYKAPGVLNALRYSKKDFWFGDEPVPHAQLDNYLRGEKAEIAHPTAAWSSQTGKGLLYFTKRGYEKSSPQGVLNLSDVSDLRKDGMLGFVFNLHGQKHSFQAANAEERDEWVTSIEREIEKARAAKETVVGHAGYKDSLTQLGRRTALGAGSFTRATSSSGKSSDLATAGGVTRDNASSSSSSSSERGTRTKKSRAPKSRSVSRGKRASIFGNIMGKKEEHDAKPDSDHPFHAGSAAPLNAAGIADRVLSAPTEATAANVTSGVSSTAEPFVAGPAAATSGTTTSKSTKRNSVFGNFITKMTSPTVEKKEHEVGLGVPSRDRDSSVMPTAAATSADAMVTSPVETSANGGSAAAAGAAASTPHREKESFFGRLLNKDKTATSDNLNTSTPVQRTSGEYATGTTPEASKEKRRSIFRNLSGSVKKERDVGASYDGAGDDAKAKKGGLSDIFRRPSKIVKSQKETRNESSSGVVVPGATDASTNHHAVPLPPGINGTTGTMDTAAVSANSTTNGDVMPHAVTVGHPESRTTAVHASA